MIYRKGTKVLVMSISGTRKHSSRNSRTGSCRCSSRSSCNIVFLILISFILAVLLSSFSKQAAVQVVTASSPPLPSPPSLTTSKSIVNMKRLSGGGGTQNDNTIDVVNNENNDEICIIFSDLDGTLIHYPDKDNKEDKLSNKDLLHLPKSSTGMSGIISSKTLCSIRNIRNGNCGGVGGSNSNVKFVLISGMRTSTFLQRLPYLPKADAYATENGGRIFYPLEDNNSNNNNNKDSINNDNKNTFWVKPKRFKGSTKDDLIPFGIHEDMNWRKKMINTKALGGRGDGYDDRDDDIGDGDTSDDNSSGYACFALLDQKQEDVLRERDGLLWDFARDLIHNKHFKIDTKGYSTCFRVNRKHQNQNQRNVESSSENKFIFKFEDLYNGKLLNQPPWIIDDDTNTDNGNNNAIDEDGHIILSEPIQSKIAWSVNLNCVDFYPSISGKKNCCAYLASKFFPERCGGGGGGGGGYNRHNNPVEEQQEMANTANTVSLFLSKHSICLCDDDNDLEMALACQHAYLPDISSQSMLEITQKYPKHFTIPFATTTATTTTTTNDDGDGDDNINDDDDGPTSVVKKGTTDATDLALSMIMERLKLRRF